MNSIDNNGLIKYPIVFDHAKKATMTARWQGHTIKLKVKSPDNITLEQAQNELDAKLKKKIKKLGKKLTKKEQKECDEKLKEPQTRLFDPLSGISKIEKGTVDPLYLSVDPMQPVELKLVPLLLFRESLKQNIIPDKLKYAFSMMQTRLENKPHVDVDFDKTNLNIVFRHQERELQAILNVEDLEQYIGGSLTITRESPSMAPRVNSAFMLTIQSRNRYVFQEKKLIDAADKFFNENVFNSISVDPTISISDLIPRLLSEFPGFCIGEVHHEFAAKKFIVDHILQLKEAGVKFLFLEHLFNDTMQIWLDDYFNSPAVSPMPPYLQRYLENLDRSIFISSSSKDTPFPQYSYSGLVRMAKAEGIQVIGLDTSVAYTVGSTDKLGVTSPGEALRYKAMNYVAQYIIKKYMPLGKFIALMGSAHVGNCRDVPGVSDILACPSIVIEQNMEEKPQMAHNVPNFKNEVKKIGIYLNFN